VVTVTPERRGSFSRAVSAGICCSSTSATSERTPLAPAQLTSREARSNSATTASRSRFARAEPSVPPNASACSLPGHPVADQACHKTVGRSARCETNPVSSPSSRRNRTSATRSGDAAGSSSATSRSPASSAAISLPDAAGTWSGAAANARRRSSRPNLLSPSASSPPIGVRSSLAACRSSGSWPSDALAAAISSVSKCRTASSSANATSSPATCTGTPAPANLRARVATAFCPERVMTASCDQAMPSWRWAWRSTSATSWA